MIDQRGLNNTLYRLLVNTTQLQSVATQSIGGIQIVHLTPIIPDPLADIPTFDGT